jgi:hypothetical protein
MLVKLTIANMLFEMTTVLWRDTDENKWILFRFDSLNFFFWGGVLLFTAQDVGALDRRLQPS